MLQGFRKVDPDRWEFSNEYFLRDRPDLLGEIYRRKPSAAERGQRRSEDHHSAIEVGAFGGLQQEVDSLKRDNKVLMSEVIRLRQQQQDENERIAMMEERLQLSEQRQQQTIAFIGKALQHPALVQHFLSASPAIRRIDDGRRESL
jgi:heat shock transcription factor